MLVQKMHLSRVIDISDLEKEKKSLLKEIVKKIFARTDPEKIKYSQRVLGQHFGHSHLHTIGIISEYRTVTRDGKIIKFVPPIIVSGVGHNPDEKYRDATINFQLDVNEAELLIKNLSGVIEETKIQISGIRKKFGGNIID